MMPQKFNNKTNGITQRRFLLHGNPMLADWVTAHVGNGWITDLKQIHKNTLQRKLKGIFLFFNFLKIQLHFLQDR